MLVSMKRGSKINEDVGLLLTSSIHTYNKFAITTIISPSVT